MLLLGWQERQKSSKNLAPTIPKVHSGVPGLTWSNSVKNWLIKHQSQVVLVRVILLQYLNYRKDDLTTVR